MPIFNPPPAIHSVSGGTTRITSGEVVFTNANGVSFGINGNTVSATVATNYLTTAMASNRGTDFVQAAAAFHGTNASGTIASNALSISVAAGGGGAVTFSAGAASAGLSSVVFSNSNGVSFGLNGSTITATVQTNYLTTAMASNAATISNIKISAGTLSAHRSDLSFNNSNGVSFGLETNGILTATVVTNYLTTAMASNRGSDFVQATAAFAGTSASGTIASGGISVSIGPYLTTAALSNHSHGNPQLNLTNLSGTTNSNSAGFTLSLSAGAPGGGAGYTQSVFAPYDECELLPGQVGQGTLAFMPQVFPNVAFDRACARVLVSKATNSTGSATISLRVGLYTKNESTLSLAHSSSTTLGLTLSGTANSSLYSGPRVMTLGWTTTIPSGDYWIGFLSQTATGANAATISNLVITQMASNFSGILGAASATSAQRRLGQGIFTATTAALPGSVAFSQISGTGSIHHRPPTIYFRSGTV